MYIYIYVIYVSVHMYKHIRYIYMYIYIYIYVIYVSVHMYKHIRFFSHLYIYRTKMAAGWIPTSLFNTDFNTDYLIQISTTLLSFRS